MRNNKTTQGIIFHIQEYAVQDGPGIRTTIFFKGCPLSCRWCSNPEGQLPHAELMWSKILCRRCKQCISWCPENAVSIDHEGYPLFKRNICLSCVKNTCEKKCPVRAIKIVGKYWSAQALYERIKTNALFYRNSNGGVTLSGGEPFAQPEFVKEFLIHCEITGLSVGVETCGQFDWNRVKDFIDRFDFYYFDIKCMDTEIHKHVTGQGNEAILENLRRLAASNPEKIIVTIPVIPGINATAEMITKTADFCKDIGITRIRLLPYHALGKFKYRALGRKYLMKDDLFVRQTDLDMFKTIIISKEIYCWIE